MAETDDVDVAEPQPGSEDRRRSGILFATCHHCETEIYLDDRGPDDDEEWVHSDNGEVECDG
jgi:hypothetical protein